MAAVLIGLTMLASDVAFIAISSIGEAEAAHPAGWPPHPPQLFLRQSSYTGSLPPCNALPSHVAGAAFPPPPPAGIIGLECSYILPIFLRLTVARRWFKKGEPPRP